ncbi:hypothetical protein FOC33_12810 [Plesiomonas shigelloides]|nr:hypothetical protein FOC33_12810 [Plesiomonas shigelloides]
MQSNKQVTLKSNHIQFNQSKHSFTADALPTTKSFFISILNQHLNNFIKAFFITR